MADVTKPARRRRTAAHEKDEERAPQQEAEQEERSPDETAAAEREGAMATAGRSPTASPSTPPARAPNGTKPCVSAR